jgi:hypothetical protein
MIIGVCTIELHLPGVGSLKQKRSIMKPLLARLHNSFNIQYLSGRNRISRYMAVSRHWRCRGDEFDTSCAAGTQQCATLD